MVDFIQGQGPLSNMGLQQDEAASFAPRVQAPAGTAPAPADEYAETLRQARKNLYASRATGMDPLTTFLLAASQGGPGGIGASISRGGIAAQQAMGEQAKSNQAFALKDMELALEEGRYKDTLKQRGAEATSKAEEKNKPTIETIYDEKTGREVKAYVYPASTGIPPQIIGGLKFEKPEKPEKVIGFDDGLNPVYENDPAGVVYNTSGMMKIKGAARGTIEGMVIANKTIKELNDNKDAFGLTQSFETMTPDALQSILAATKLSSLTPEQRKIRAKVQEQAASVIKKFYGVAVSRGEDKRAANWQPKSNDTYEQLMPKLLNSLEYAKEVSLTLPDAVYENSGATPEYKKDFFNIRNSLAEQLDPGSSADVIDTKNPLLPQAQ